MQALVLVGGEGTRLRPLTDAVPKPALPIAGRPMISYTIAWLARHGVDEVVLACGFKAERLREVIGDGERGGPTLTYLTEPLPLGTAGAIRFAAERLGERFFALNGDILADLDLTSLLRAHEELGARATIALHPVDDSADYGLVTTGPGGEVTEFREKPADGQLGPGNINAGAYVLERSVLDLVPEGRAVSIEREVFPELVGNGLYGIPLDGYWLDVGTHERYEQAERDVAAGLIGAEVAP
jgi:mannose-1-phosphate guanylyltransferase